MTADIERRVAELTARGVLEQHARSQVAIETGTWVGDLWETDPDGTRRPHDAGPNWQPGPGQARPRPQPPQPNPLVEFAKRHHDDDDDAADA